MSALRKGDRVRVVKDLSGLGSFVGRTGTVTYEGAAIYRGDFATSPTVRLDSEGADQILCDLHFAPEELEPVVPDGDADAADAARDQDKAERLIGGAQ